MIRHRPMSASLLAGASAVALFAAGPVSAQTAGASDDDNVVIVTAQRRDQNLQQVPIAITAFSMDQIEAADLADTSDLVRFTPSMTGGMNTGTGAAVSYFIRGLGSTEQVPSFDVPVATYVDEVYVARQSANNILLLDVQQIEVLRGPQGTLFGRNTTGGAISIRTRQPGREFGYNLALSMGSFDRTQIVATVDMPLSETAGTKLTLLRVTDAGYGRSVTTGERLNGEEASGLRVAGRFDVSEAVTWNLSVDWMDQDRTTLGSLAYDPRYVSRTGLRQTACGDDILNTFLAERRGNCSNVVTTNWTSNLAWDLGWATATLISAERDVNQNFALDFLGGTNPAGGFTIANQVDNSQTSHELKLVGDTGNVSWVAGLYYLTEDSQTDQIDTAGALILGDRRMLNETESVAAYAQADILFGEALTLTLGGRWTDETKNVSFIDTVRPYPAGWVTVALAAPANRPTNANLTALGIPLEQSETRFTPRIALAYQMTPDIMLFTSYTEGFKSGGWNGRPTTAATATAFGPEYASTIELGVRSEFLDGRARINATLYRLEVEDLQLLSGFAVGAGIAFVTRNTGGLEATGLELETQFTPVEGLNIFATASFADREYVDIPAANGAGNVPCSNTPEPAQCTTTRDAPVRFPETQATLGATYELPVPAFGGRFGINGAVSYSSEYWTSTYNDTGTSTGVSFGGSGPVTAPLSLVPDTTLVNVGVSWTSGSDRYQLSVDCTNCTEEYYLGSSLAGLGYPNDPRRIMATLRVRH